MNRVARARSTFRLFTMAALFTLPAALFAQDPVAADGDTAATGTPLRAEVPTGEQWWLGWWKQHPKRFWWQGDLAQDAGHLDGSVGRMGAWSPTRPSYEASAIRRARLALSPDAAGQNLDVNATGYIVPPTGDTYATVHVGVASSGTVTHAAGGTLTVTSEVDLGYNAGTTGTYNLSNGTLATQFLFVGYNGTGNFAQTGGTVTITSGGEVDLGSIAATTSSNNYTISGGSLATPLLVIGDGSAATFTQSGNSTVTTDRNIFTGLQFAGNASAVYQLNGGLLTVAGVTNNGTVLNTGSFNFNGGTLQASASDNPGSDPSNTTFLAGIGAANVQAGGARLDTQAFNVTVAQPLLHNVTGVDGGLTKLGTGTLTLAGANTYNGPTAINAGVVRAGVASVVGTSGALGVNSAVTLANVAGAGLNLNGFNTQIGSLTGGGSAGGNVVLSTATLTTGGDNTSPAAYAGVISGAGGVTKIGTGTQTLSGTNTYTGGTAVAAGRLTESNNGNALSTGTVAISGGTTVELSNTTASNINQAGNTFSGAGTLQKTGTGTLSFGGTGGTVNVALAAGGVIDVQAGTLKGSSTYQASYTGNLGGLNIASGATFDGVEGTVRVDALTGAGTLAGGYGTSTNLSVSGSTTLGVNGGSGTFSGVIQDGGSAGGTLTLIKAGAGTQTLSGTNTYTGSTTINGGTLAVSNNATTAQGRLANTGFIILNNGGTLLLTGSPLNADRLNNAAAVTINGGGKFGTGGLSEGTAPTAAGGVGGAAGVGALTLAGTSSTLRATIDFGTGNGSTLVFSSLVASSANAYVTVLGFTGTAYNDSGAATNDRLLFTSDPGFTLAQLANWQFSNDAGTSFMTGAREVTYNGYFEIVPVPEPATWLGGALLLGVAGLAIRRLGTRVSGSRPPVAAWCLPG